MDTLTSLLPNAGEPWRSRPQYPSAHLNLGKALDARGFPDDAISHYQKALEIQPDFAAAHNNLANILTAQGSFDEAIAHCRKALEIVPDRAPTHFILATALTGRGEIDEAIAEYRTGLAMKPDDALAARNSEADCSPSGKESASKRPGQRDLLARASQRHGAAERFGVVSGDQSQRIVTRNGAEAVVLAERAAKLSYERNLRFSARWRRHTPRRDDFRRPSRRPTRPWNWRLSKTIPILAESIKHEIRIYEAGRRLSRHLSLSG